VQFGVQCGRRLGRSTPHCTRSTHPPHPYAPAAGAHIALKLHPERLRAPPRIRGAAPFCARTAPPSARCYATKNPSFLHLTICATFRSNFRGVRGGANVLADFLSDFLS
jgi:hypothetical protein